uniref:alkaline phosphatase PhoX n=1 Tax=Streptomyces sp. GbtcB7 TaxID=2824752 RepID=UPI001C2FFC81
GVDPVDRGRNRNPKPIKALGRYAHGAVVVAPKRGRLYLTGDASGPNGLLYPGTPPRGLGHGPGQLATRADDAAAPQASKG